MSDATAGSAKGAEADDPVVYAVTLAPHRSLSRRGFLVVMGAMGAVSLGSGLVFLSMGAWPVFGFFGLDVLALYLAFRANFHAARAREHIVMTASLIEVREEPARGRPTLARLNPFWTRLSRVDDEDYGTLDLAFESGRRRVPVGRFLGPREKGHLAGELAAALSYVKKGVTRNGEAPTPS